MPNDVANFFLFFLSLGTVGIAILAELSFRTPTGFLYSLIRSTICIGCIIFASIVLSPNHQASVLQFLAIGFVFFCSLMRFFKELEHEHMRHPDHFTKIQK